MYYFIINKTVLMKMYCAAMPIFYFFKKYFIIACITMCAECPVCPIDGLVCDPNTGDCVCPPHTTGKLCEKCEENHWGYNITTGCQVSFSIIMGC